MQLFTTRREGPFAGGDMGRPRRRRFIVDGKFQLALVGNMLLIVGAGMLASALIVGWTVVYYLSDRLTCAIDTGYLMKMGIILGFVLAGITIWTVRRSLAISGPVYKIRSVLQAAVRGEFPAHPVALRRGDAFTELATDLNRCLEIMRADREQLKRLQARAENLQQTSRPS